MDNYFGRSGWSNIDIRSNVWPTVGLYGVPLTLHSFGTAALPLQSLTLSKNWHPCQFLDMSFLLCKKHHYCLEPRTSMSGLCLTSVSNGEREFRLCRNIASDSLNRPPCPVYIRVRCSYAVHHPLQLSITNWSISLSSVVFTTRLHRFHAFFHRVLLISTVDKLSTVHSFLFRCPKQTVFYSCGGFNTPTLASGLLISFK